MFNSIIKKHSFFAPLPEYKACIPKMVFVFTPFETLSPPLFL